MQLTIGKSNLFNLEPLEKIVNGLIPLPTKLENGDGSLESNSEFRVGLAGHMEPRLEQAATRLVERISLLTGIPLSQNATLVEDDVRLLIHIGDSMVWKKTFSS